MTSPTRAKVLVADDEHVIADTLVMILNHSGYEARAVYSGEEAVEEAASFMPSLLILDVVMGGMTGIDAAIQIQSKSPTCKILLFSGQAASTGLLKEANEQGYNFELLAKPVHPVDLLAKLREQLTPTEG